MLFKKKIEPHCAYCKKGVALEDDLMLCIKKGVVQPVGYCRAFRYDPLKRMPARPATPDFSKLKDEDFAL
jgi:hypothetical protein